MPCEGEAVVTRTSVWIRDLSVYSWGQMLKWLARISLIMVTVYAILGVAIPITFGWWPTYGRSMRPTLPIIGGYLKALPDKDPEIGDIVRFRSLHRWLGIIPMTDVKRVEEVREDGSIWVTADNGGWTGEDSIEYGWVSENKIIYVAADIWSPTRFWRSRTSRGRFENWKQFYFSRQDYTQISNVTIYSGRLAQTLAKIYQEGPEESRRTGELVREETSGPNRSNVAKVVIRDGGPVARIDLFDEHDSSVGFVKLDAVNQDIYMNLPECVRVTLLQLNQGSSKAVTFLYALSIG